MTRREARETVFALLYEYDFNRTEDPAAVYANAVAVRGIEDHE
jgi:transcription termination factor NusB